MKTSVLTAFWIISLSATCFGANVYTQEDVVNILIDNGFANVRQFKTQSVIYACDNKYVSLNLNSDGGISTSFNQTGYNVSLSDINEWNRNVRNTRAYKNNENYVVKADLSPFVQATPDELAQYASKFCLTVSAFLKYLKDHAIKP